MAQVKSPKDNHNKAKKLSKIMKEKWKNVDFKKERSKTQSKIMTEKWQDPVFANHISTKNRERNQSAEYKANMSVIMTNLYSTDEKRQQLSESRTTALQNPQIYNAHVQMLKDTALIRSEKMKDNWQDPDFCYRVMTARYGEERAKRYVYNKFGVIK
jgi:hypothetical protein